MAYLSAAGIEACLQYLAATYPAICQLIVLPEPSVEGRTSRAVKISHGGGERHGVLFIGGVHARELVNPDTLVGWALDLCEAYTANTGLTYGPKVFDASTIKRGHYVRVSGSVIGNDDSGNPGVYVNHQWLMHAGIGPEIKSGVDAKTAFAAPAVAPTGMAPVPQTAAQAAFIAPPAPALPPRAAPPPAAPSASTQTVVQPSASFIAPPAAPAAPTPPPPPAAPRWDAAKAGNTYEAFKAAGWSDDQMRAAGYLA